MRIVVTLMILLFEAWAVSPQALVGNWQAVKSSLTNGTQSTEKEYLQLKADRTFSLMLLVSVEKDDAFVKDLKIEVSGIWKVRDDTLVAVVKSVAGPVAKEVYRISQESLRNLALTFENRFTNDPIRIIRIKHIDQGHFTSLNEELKETSYTRR
jgi:hypothetical protein